MSVLLPPGLLVEVLPMLGWTIVCVATHVGPGVESGDVGVQRDLIRVPEALAEGPVRSLTESGLGFGPWSLRFVGSRVAGEAQVLPGLLVVTVEATLVSARVKCADGLSVDGAAAILQPETQITKRETCVSRQLFGVRVKGMRKVVRAASLSPSARSRYQKADSNNNRAASSGKD